MVIAVERPSVAPEIDRPVDVSAMQSNGAVADGRMTCPRCEARLRIIYYEPECLQCGFADYQYTPAPSPNGKKSLMTTGTESIVRYAGQSPSLAETLTHVKLTRLRNRAVYNVKCPFCDRPMAQSSLSGKRREVREERYKCTEGHRVSLIPGKDGSLAWK